jgi:hypothetical protein
MPHLTPGIVKLQDAIQAALRVAESDPRTVTHVRLMHSCSMMPLTHVAAMLDLRQHRMLETALTRDATRRVHPAPDQEQISAPVASRSHLCQLVHVRVMPDTPQRLTRLTAYKAVATLAVRHVQS